MRGRARGHLLAAAALTLALVGAGCSSDGGTGRSHATTPLPTTSSPVPATTSPSRAAESSSPHRHSSATRTKRASSAPAPARTHTSTTARPSARKLPVDLSTDNARQVITVTAPGHSSTTATLQRWRRVAGGWRTVGLAVQAYLGSAGLGRASEGSSKTPAGSFTLTQAFGHDRNPGTTLPYTHTTPADWWISEPGPLYNTRQRCSSGCDFTRGDPNEHLYATMPYYRYAVVIDYNTRNAPGGVHQGGGSAFFLHVAVGQPTAGCVAISQESLVTVLHWLDPAKHPRILISTE